MKTHRTLEFVRIALRLLSPLQSNADIAEVPSNRWRLRSLNWLQSRRGSVRRTETWNLRLTLTRWNRLTGKGAESKSVAAPVKRPSQNNYAFQAYKIAVDQELRESIGWVTFSFPS
jgi:hypothetical protein